MEPQIPTADSQGFIPVVRFRLDWMSKVTKLNQWITHNVVLSQSVLYQPYSGISVTFHAMTQASVDSLAIKHFIKELKSETLSRDVKITFKTDSSAGKMMASRLGISKRSKHIELKHLWIQDILSDVTRKGRNSS